MTASWTWVKGRASSTERLNGFWTAWRHLRVSPCSKGVRASWQEIICWTVPPCSPSTLLHKLFVDIYFTHQCPRLKPLSKHAVSSLVLWLLDSISKYIYTNIYTHGMSSLKLNNIFLHNSKSRRWPGVGWLWYLFRSQCISTIIALSGCDGYTKAALVYVWSALAFSF